MNTFTPTPTTIKRNWHLIDAKGEIMGRIAAKAAVLLMGKNKSDYAPHLDTGDNVVIINAEKFVTTGRKDLQKEYVRHSGYPGGLRKTTLGKLRQEKPGQALTRAISGMLPDNKLKKSRLMRLHLFMDETHPYGQHLK